MVVIQIETLYTLSILNFACIYRISRVLIFANAKFLKILKKTIESRDIRLMFLSRSTEKQAGHDGKTD